MDTIFTKSPLQHASEKNWNISYFIQGIISTWRGERFYSYTGHGYRWPKFIYSTINGIDDYTCAMYCHHDTQCSYYVYYGSSCYLGDCAQTTQTLSNQGHGVVYYKYGKSEKFHFVFLKTHKI